MTPQPVAVSAARDYWESQISLYNAADLSFPAAVSVFPGENYRAPRSWVERAYHKLICFDEVDSLLLFMRPKELRLPGYKGARHDRHS
jgi:hypothetical protein